MIRTFAATGFLFLFSLSAAARPAIASAGGWQDASKPSSQTKDSSPAPSQTPPAGSTKPKPKKVWTNDNVPDSGTGVSVVGSAGTGRGSKGQSKPTSNDSVDPQVVASLRDQLQRLQAQLNIVEKQYSDLKAQSKGDSKSAGGLQQNTFGYDSSSVDEQLRHLQEKKKRLEAAIDELLEAARKAGIEPGQLR